MAQHSHHITLIQNTLNEEKIICSDSHSSSQFFFSPPNHHLSRWLSCIGHNTYSSIHPFRMRVNEIKSQAELFTVERPVACSAAGCKCCCYQKAKFTSQGVPLGMVQETFYCCVPTFKLLDASGRPIYKIHPPTCCGGCCLNCFTEGSTYR